MQPVMLLPLAMLAILLGFTVWAVTDTVRAGKRRRQTDAALAELCQARGWTCQREQSLVRATSTWTVTGPWQGGEVQIQVNSARNTHSALAIFRQSRPGRDTTEVELLPHTLPGWLHPYGQRALPLPPELTDRAYARSHDPEWAARVLQAPHVQALVKRHDPRTQGYVGTSFRASLTLPMTLAAGPEAVVVSLPWLEATPADVDEVVAALMELNVV